MTENPFFFDRERAQRVVEAVLSGHVTSPKQYLALLEQCVGVVPQEVYRDVYDGMGNKIDEAQALVDHLEVPGGVISIKRLVSDGRILVGGQTADQKFGCHLNVNITGGSSIEIRLQAPEAAK
jgi:hypothetical protein